MPDVDQGDGLVVELSLAGGVVLGSVDVELSLAGGVSLAAGAGVSAAGAGVSTAGAGVSLAAGAGVVASAAGLSADVSAFSFWLSQAATPSAPATAKAVKNFRIACLS